MWTYIFAILCIGVGIVFDQYTKYLAITYLQNSPLPIVEGVFELHYLENRGAAFGILQNQQWFFLIIGVLLLFVVLKLYITLPHTKRLFPLRICMLSITCGAIGNMIDRIRLNYVIDFLYFKLIDFPIFNVADIYVSVATFALVILFLFYYKEDELDEFFCVLSLRKRTEQE